MLPSSFLIRRIIFNMNIPVLHPLRLRYLKYIKNKSGRMMLFFSPSPSHSCSLHVTISLVFIKCSKTSFLSHLSLLPHILVMTVFIVAQEACTDYEAGRPAASFCICHLKAADCLLSLTFLHHQLGLILLTVLDTKHCLWQSNKCSVWDIKSLVK